MTYDLIVVGTSFASSFFLKKYLEVSGKKNKVLVLERGKFIPHNERLEHTRTLPRGTVNYKTSANYKSTYINNNPDKPWIFDPSFGGSSNCWTGCTPRLMPNDFRLKSTYNIGMDWPVSYADLEPYYCEVEDIMAISGPDLTPFPMSRGYPQPPHRLSTVDEVMQKEYGSLYISQPTARSSITNKRNQCCTSSICHMCPNDAKFTIMNGLQDIYEDPRVSVSYDSQVIRLDTSGNHIKGVSYLHNGRERTARAEVVALGANPIFNAHILLNSGDTNPFTGRFLAEQVGYCAYVYLDGFKNVGGTSIITSNCYKFYDEINRAQMGGCLIENHNGFFVRHEFNRWREIARFKFIFEDIPQFNNHVSLSDNPATPNVNYVSHSPYVIRGYLHLKSSLEKFFSPLPVEKVYLDTLPVSSEGHILGTTRMSANSSDGVIDRHMIHHTYRNLFVLGASSFPTISPSNPTLTLSALSLWAAEKSFGA